MLFCLAERSFITWHLHFLSLWWSSLLLSFVHRAKRGRILVWGSPIRASSSFCWNWTRWQIAEMLPSFFRRRSWRQQPMGESEWRGREGPPRVIRMYYYRREHSCYSQIARGKARYERWGDPNKGSRKAKRCKCCGSDCVMFRCYLLSLLMQGTALPIGPTVGGQLVAAGLSLPWGGGNGHPFLPSLLLRVGCVSQENGTISIYAGCST